MVIGGGTYGRLMERGVAYGAMFPDSIDTMHQANEFMLNYLAKTMKVPKESVPVAMGETGNTGPASIPLMLTLEHERLSDENRLEKAVLCGFGVGLSCAAAAVDLSEAEISTPVYV